MDENIAKDLMKKMGSASMLPPVIKCPEILYKGAGKPCRGAGCPRILIQ
jgi:hypothetical protein